MAVIPSGQIQIIAKRYHNYSLFIIQYSLKTHLRWKSIGDAVLCKENDIMLIGGEINA